MILHGGHQKETSLKSSYPKFTSLQDSLLLLAGLKSQIEPALKILAPKDRITDDDLKFTVCNHIQILVCSFLKEWKHLESIGDEIRATLEVSSPAIKRIRSWTGLWQIRSALLAHGGRDKHGKPAWAWDVFSRHNGPTTYAEPILLAQCALLATNEALRRHQAEYQAATGELQELPRTIEEKGIRSLGEMNAALDAIKAEMARISESMLR
jgi:hypothetical protein